MRIAIASGKGGTGKTTVATSLALSLAGREGYAAPLLLDCDVEAPNAHLFVHPQFDAHKEVSIRVPVVDEGLCTRCGACAAACQYHAIIVMGGLTLVFPELCHGCGSCGLVCPEHAIRETSRVIGRLERGSTPAGLHFGRGVLNVGEPMGVPIIRQLKKWMEPLPDQVVILDASPGTSCPVVAAILGSDYLVLVTEPTPFGLHDLKLAVELARDLGLPAGVVINRAGIGDAAVEEYCAAAGLPILMRIPFMRTIAEGIASGHTLTQILPEYEARFLELCARIEEIVRRSRFPEAELNAAGAKHEKAAL